MKNQQLLAGLALGLAGNSIVSALGALLPSPYSIPFLAIAAVTFGLWAIDLLHADHQARLNNRLLIGGLLVVGLLGTVLGMEASVYPEAVASLCAPCPKPWLASIGPLALVAGLATAFFAAGLGAIAAVTEPKPGVIPGRISAPTTAGDARSLVLAGTVGSPSPPAVERREQGMITAAIVLGAAIVAHGALTRFSRD